MWNKIFRFGHAASRIADRERTYIVHVPPGHDSTQPAPIVLLFHGGLGNAENMQRMTGFDAVADANDVIAVYPNGTGRFEDKLLTWNGGQCCGYAVEQGIDDVGFVEALIEDLAKVANVDRKQIYATGMSNGAIMSYRLACGLSDVVAAIGPVATTQNVDNCQPERPVPVIHFHGTDDQHAPYKGGIGAESLANVEFTSVTETIQFWTNHNGCTTSPKREQSGTIIHINHRQQAEFLYQTMQKRGIISDRLLSRHARRMGRIDNDDKAKTLEKIVFRK